MVTGGSCTLVVSLHLDWATVTPAMRRSRSRGVRGWEGAEGGEKGEPGWPRLTLNDMLVMPSVVVKLRCAFPPEDHTVMNSARDALAKSEFIL